jgi:AcrR family transcriptional regulator
MKIEKRRRGRPRGFVPEEVLERVRAVFIEKGFSGASLDDLAAAAGLNRPSLYAAFGNKQELYIHTLRHYGERSIAALQKLLGGDGAIDQRLGTVFDAAIKLYCAPPHHPGCLIIGTAGAEAPAHPDIAETARELLERIETEFQRAFDRATAAGELSATPAAASRARLAGAVLDTLAVRARLRTDPEPLRAFARAMIPVLCR